VAVVRKISPLLFDSLEKQLLDGPIILTHVGVRSTADALPAMIANLQGRGFHLVTISTLLE
jgi:peptidoglycan/xylan/chitin deacetylase (PgdA/CDA1 family)